MPAPLAKPLMTTSAPPSFTVRVASLGNVSVVMMALAASCHASGAALLGKAAQEMGELGGVQRLADDAGRRHVDLVGCTADGSRRGLRRHARRVGPLFAGEGIGVAGIDDQRPRLALLEVLAAPEHRRRARLGLREHAGNGRAGVQHGHHQVGAVGVADAGLAGRQPARLAPPARREAAPERTATAAPSTWPWVSPA